MINKNEVDEAKEKFCNPHITLGEASAIVQTIIQRYNSEQTTSLFIEDNLYSALEMWEIVREWLVWKTLIPTFTESKLVEVESVLGTKVALQIYRLHLEERLRTSQQPYFLIPYSSLVKKMKYAKFSEELFMEFLTLSEEAKYKLG